MAFAKVVQKKFRENGLKYFLPHDIASSANQNWSGMDSSNLASKSSRKRQLAWIILVFLGIVVCDQVSKAIIRATIPPGSVSFQGREKQFFYFTHERNEGLVGGIFGNKDQRIIARIAPVVASLILLFLYRNLDPVSKFQSIAYGMVLGGAVGNIIDRFTLGSVTDFLQFHFYFIPFDFPWKRYPAFNIADSAICVGVFLLIIGWHRLGTGTNVSRTN